MFTHNNDLHVWHLEMGEAAGIFTLMGCWFIPLGNTFGVYKHHTEECSVSFVLSDWKKGAIFTGLTFTDLKGEGKKFN